MRNIVHGAAGVLIACAALLQIEPTADLTGNAAIAQETTRYDSPPVLEDKSGCEAGCSTSSHPVEPLTHTEYRHLLHNYASGDDRVRLAALETLLFHGKDVARWLDSETTGLGNTDADLLRHELTRTHVRMWMRLVDDSGVVRARIDGVSFPIGEKTHVHMTDTQDLQSLEASGTVHRTGLHHLWTRL